MKSPTAVELVWEHDLVFGGKTRGKMGDTLMTLDSLSIAGPSPMQALGFALAGCMAMDIVYILQKGRHDLKGLKVELIAARASDVPHRFTSVEMRYVITGDVPADHIQRAIDLSHDKYCSVWHSLRQDLDYHVSFTVSSAQ